jgi:hypothetical protein
MNRDPVLHATIEQLRRLATRGGVKAKNGISSKAIAGLKCIINWSFFVEQTDGNRSTVIAATLQFCIVTTNGLAVAR